MILEFNPFDQNTGVVLETLAGLWCKPTDKT
jgi:hypothetical protein